MRVKIAAGFKLAGEPSERDRAVGAAIGSGVSNLITGTLAAPFLFASEGRRFSLKALKAAPVKHLRQIYDAGALGKGLALSGVSMLGGGIRELVQAGVEKRRKQANGDMLEHYQDLARRAKAGDKKAQASLARRKKHADQGASSGAHSGDLLRVSAPVSAPIGVDEDPKDYVARRRASGKKRTRSAGKTAADEDAAEEGLGPVPLYSRPGSTDREQREKSVKRSVRRKQATQVGIMVYQRDPGELPEAKRPSAPKGNVARMFGKRMSGAHALHRRAKKQEDEWMGENGEFVEVGRRPGLVEALRDVAGVEQDQVLSRSDVSKLVAERKQAKSSAYGRRREKGKAKEHVHTHAPDDLVELYKAFEMLLENPASKYFQVVG